MRRPTGWAALSPPGRVQGHSGLAVLPSGLGRRLIAPLTPSGRPRRCEDGARGAAPASRPGAGVSKTGVIFGVEPGRRFSTSSREVAQKRHPLYSPQSLSPRNARACANEALADVTKQVQEQPPTAALEGRAACVRSPRGACALVATG